MSSSYSLVGLAEELLQGFCQARDSRVIAMEI